MPRPTRTPKIAESFSEMRAEYDAARENQYRRRRFGVTGTPRTADYHVRNDGRYFKMMEIARDMDRNDPMLGQAIDRAVDNTIQTGPTLDPDTGDKKLDKEIRSRFSDWADDPDMCDLAGEMNFQQMGRTVLRQSIVDGDIFPLPNENGSIGMAEAHRCRTPSRIRRNVVNGVLLDDNRRRVEYWFTKDEIDSATPISLADIQPIKARDKSGYRQVLQVYNPRRVSQTRGVTALAPMVDIASIMGDTVFAILVKIQTSACWAVVRNRSVGFSGQGERVKAGSQSTEFNADGTTRTVEEIYPGMDIPGQNGETLTPFSPQVVANESIEFIEMLLGWLGCNIGMPIVMMTLDSRQTNFSGWRGSFEQAKMGFRENQRMLTRRFYTPVYQWKLRHWMAEGDEFSQRLLGAPRAFSHLWGMPSWPYIEPVKDAAADLLQIRNGLNSPRRVQQERGRDLSDIQDETVEDNGRAIEIAIKKAKQLTESLGEPVNWRELLCLPTPDGVTVKLGTDEGSPAK